MNKDEEIEQLREQIADLEEGGRILAAIAGLLDDVSYVGTYADGVAALRARMQQLEYALSRRAPEAGQVCYAHETICRTCNNDVMKCVGPDKMPPRKRWIDPLSKPQAQAEPKPDKFCVGYTPGADSVTVETAEGQEPVGAFGGKRETPTGTNEFWGLLTPDFKGLPMGAPLYTQPQRPAEFIEVDGIRVDEQWVRDIRGKLGKTDYMLQKLEAQHPEMPDEWRESAKHIVFVYDQNKEANNEFGQKAAFASAIGLLRELLTAAPAPERPVISDVDILNRAASLLLNKSDEAESAGLPDTASEIEGAAMIVKAEAKRLEDQPNGQG